ncbi:MAG TPA: ribokinase [Ktedonobacterales bacterium]|nr:ribokinase [Ktedonobacterales bacterium]
MARVLVQGSLNVDHVALIPHLPIPGETVLGEAFHIFAGGKGLNQAIAAHRLGADVRLIGCIGQDHLGDLLQATLLADGVDTSLVTRQAEFETGVCCVLVGIADGQNMIGSIRQANMALDAAMIDAAFDQIAAEPAEARPNVFLAQCETEVGGVVRGLQRARDLRMTTILNLAPVPREAFDNHLFQLSDILIVNEIEAGLLTGVTVDGFAPAAIAAQALLKRGPMRVIITLGALGATHSARDDSAADPATRITHREWPAYAVRAVDATAAGDAFCGAFASKVAGESAVDEVMAFALAAGALTATRPGAAPSLPTRLEVEAMLKNQT